MIEWKIYRKGERKSTRETGEIYLGILRYTASIGSF